MKSSSASQLANQSIQNPLMDSVTKTSQLNGKNLGESTGSAKPNLSIQKPQGAQKSLYGSQMIGSKIAKLQDTGNFYAHKIEQDTKKLEAIEKEIEKTEKILEDKRKDMMTKKKASNENDPFTLKRQIKSMVQKLDYLKKKYNESLANNDTLKEQINHLRREKNIFDNIYVELKTELSEKKEQLKKVLVESRAAKQEISKGQERLTKYQQEAELDKKKFDLEFQSVYQSLPDSDARDDKLKEKFLSGSKVLNTNHEDRPVSPFEKSAYDFENFRLMNNGMGTAGVNARKKEIAKKNQQKENQHLENLKAEVSSYEDIFQKLLEETGTQDMSKIIKTFVDYENENYSLFKYINTLRDETEILNNQKKHLQEQIELYQNKPTEYRQEPKTIKFMELKSEIEKMEEKKEKHLNKHKVIQEQIDQLKTCIPTMFNEVGCLAPEYISEIPKNNDGTLQPIEESNMLLYLAAIERRTNDLLQLYTDLYKQKQLGDPKSKGVEESNLSTSQIVHKAIKFDDLDLALDPLQDEFKVHFEKVKEDKRNKEYQIANEVIKEKDFMDLKDFQENAKNEFKKISVKTKVSKKK